MFLFILPSFPYNDKLNIKDLLIWFLPMKGLYRYRYGKIRRTGL